jgi:hypothetical protein
MVEFPLVARRFARVCGAGWISIPDQADLTTLASSHLPSSNRLLALAGMWETSTFEASFHARLNVASAGIFEQKQR